MAQSIDEITLEHMMSHLKVDDHDVLAGYVRRLGIEHKDSNHASTA